MSTILQFHPYAEIFPLIEGEEFEQLADNIRQHGLIEPIWLYNDLILDGRNRYLACLEAEVKPKFRVFEGDDDAALSLVISSNVHRRHLTVGQRAMAAAKAATLQAGGDRRSENFKTARAAPSQTEAGRAFDVSTDSVQRARKVIDNGSDDLKRAVETGAVPLKKAAKVADLPKPQQLEAAKQKEVAKEPDLSAPEWTAEDEAQYLAQEEADARERIEAAMAADDKLAEAFEQIKKQAHEIAVLKKSRDHYMRQANEAVRLLKVEQRKVAKLERAAK